MRQNFCRARLTDEFPTQNLPCFFAPTYLEEIEGEIEQVSGDGGYDTFDCHKAIQKKEQKQRFHRKRMQYQPTSEENQQSILEIKFWSE